MATNLVQKDLHILSLITDDHSTLLKSGKDSKGISRWRLCLAQASHPENAGVSGGPAWMPGWEDIWGHTEFQSKEQGIS